MDHQPVIHNTFVIERSYPVPPERVFAAFADPEQKRRWFVEGEGHEVESYDLDFRVRGEEHARFRFTGQTPVSGLACANDIIYQDIVPNRRIVTASTMAIGGRNISASLCTFEFVATLRGTDLVFTHQAAFFEGADGPEMREAGWLFLLGRLDAEVALAHA